MAVVRTVLPRKGIIEPQHGNNYELDVDTNWQTIDSLLQDATDVQNAVMAAGTVAAWLNDIGLCGVVSGLALSTSASLTPGLSAGVLYAQGARYAPSTPAPGAAPANSASFLWFNSATGFYFNFTGTAGTVGDAYLGSLTTDSTHVTAVTGATKINGRVAVAAGAAGNFSLVHNLGRAPLGVMIYMTSGGALWFQPANLFDATNLYLTASDAGITASIQVW
ncbi:MAG TPA: hypothetical protein VG028_04080 [Terriglobia bacterium]|nr:hypothetical protein [Terriglobia bacterium]